jgi:hypothetical protein
LKIPVARKQSGITPKVKQVEAFHIGHKKETLDKMRSLIRDAETAKGRSSVSINDDDIIDTIKNTPSEPEDSYIPDLKKEAQDA